MPCKNCECPRCQKSREPKRTGGPYRSGLPHRTRAELGLPSLEGKSLSVAKATAARLAQMEACGCPLCYRYCSAFEFSVPMEEKVKAGIYSDKNYWSTP